MIQLKNVERSYKTGAGQTWVLRRIDLTIREGEFITVMGPSGAGKSSLLNVLALLDDQWAGEYWFGEQPVHLMKRKDRAELAKRKIGMVFQSYHLLDDLTVQENIDLPLSYKDIPRSQRQGMVAETLDHFQIVAKKDLYPNQLSGGQQQLVGVARAVVHKPALLLADEPTGNLHSSQAKEIMELFSALNREGTTIVQVTHSDVNASYGSRTIQMRDGWLVGDTSNPALAPSGGGNSLMIERLLKSPILALFLCWSMVSAQAQTQAPATSPSDQMPNAPTPQTPAVSTPMQLSIHTPAKLAIPHSNNPFAAYAPSQVPEPQLDNSPRIDRLIRDGKLYISLQDAIALALENNLDLAIARYNLPIADTDIQRTKAGGSFRGVNTGVVGGTPGGGVGGFGTGAPGAGAGGTTGGAGGAGAGAAGLVQSTLGAGTPVQSYDPTVNAISGLEHQTTPLANLQIYGVPELQLNTTQVNVNYMQAFPTGTSFTFEVDNNRQATNSIYSNLSPQLGTYYRFTFQQQLLAGFGTGPNLRYLRIAKNNKKISDIAFKSQVIATVTQIANIYWDLVSAYEEERVNEQSYAFAQQSFQNAQKQLQLEAIPAMDLMRAEAEVSRRDQDLTVAKTNLQLQESLIKNALTKNLDDPVLESMPVIPTDRLEPTDTVPDKPTQDLIAMALQDRPELSESQIDLQNRQISRQAAKNALLPTLALVGFYGGTGLAGEPNPAYYLSPNTTTAPCCFTGAFADSFNNSAPDYFVGLNLTLPIRNRVAKADQYRSELEYRQAELRLQQLKKQIRIEVRNAEYALEQGRARVLAAKKARDLADKTFAIMQKEQTLGAGSSFQTLTAQRDLAVAELDLVNATTAYQKSKLELQRATGTTLEDNGIQVQDAVNGTAP